MHVAIAWCASGQLVNAWMHLFQCEEHRGRQAHRQTGNQPTNRPTGMMTMRLVVNAENFCCNHCQRNVNLA